MIWVAWRRQRLIVLLSVGVALLVSAGAFVFHLVATSYMDSHGIAGCLDAGPGCDGRAMAAFAEKFGGVTTPLTFLLLAIPPLLGAFAGGPLFAREFEHRTHVFGLTQSVGRGRWWATKVLVGAGPVVLSVLVLGLVLRWTMEPLAFVAHAPMTTPGFETRGAVMAAYTLVAFAIGATFGILFRNTLGAMAVALVLYVLLLVPIGGMARPHYADPVTAVGALQTEDDNSIMPSGSWPLDHAYLDANGQRIEWSPSPSCHEEDCMRAEGITAYEATFHAPSSFWRFQLTESAIFAGLSAVVIAVGGLVVRRRLP